MEDNRSETQLTFDDVSSDTDSSFFTTVSSIATALTKSERTRTGDNCATVSERKTESETPTFCIQLPPRSATLSAETINESCEWDFTFEASSVYQDESPPYVVWEFTAEKVNLVIVKPIDDSLGSEEDEDAEAREDMYVQFDFTKFVRQTK